MKPKLKAQWVKALCSGEYDQQFDGELANDRGYCCLGVLGKVAGMPIEDKPYLRTRTAMGKSRFHILGEDEQKGLAQMNDDGVPFEMIAGLIQEAL